MAENKERLGVGEIGGKQETRMVDVETAARAPLPREVESWMEKVEKDQTVQKIVNDDRTGQPVMTPTAPTDPVIQLPITRGTFAAGFGKAISDAGRWLSVFIFRVIKIKKGKVKFKDE
ncbi:MAG: hypothetical protein WC841_05275 [Candidatus Shapirobacteria bacterium]|jgi:hypothetical protein